MSRAQRSHEFDGFPELAEYRGRADTRRRATNLAMAAIWGVVVLVGTMLVIAAMWVMSVGASAVSSSLQSDVLGNAQEQAQPAIASR